MKACDGARMTNTNEELIGRIEALVAEHIASTRRAVQEAIERGFGAAVVKANPASPQRPSPAAASRQRSRTSATGGRKRRVTADLDALGERFYGVLCAKPGETMTVLAAEVGATARELHRAVARLKQDGRVRAVGERASTRYFPLSAAA